MTSPHEQPIRSILARLQPDNAAVLRLAAFIRGFERHVRGVTLGGTAVLTLIVALVMLLVPHDVRADIVAAIVTLALAAFSFLKPKLKTVSEAELQTVWGGKPLPQPYIKALQDLANGERALQEQWITLWGAIMVFTALLLKWIGGSTPA